MILSEMGFKKKSLVNLETGVLKEMFFKNHGEEGRQRMLKEEQLDAPCLSPCVPNRGTFASRAGSDLASGSIWEVKAMPGCEGRWIP